MLSLIKTKRGGAMENLNQRIEGINKRKAAPLGLSEADVEVERSTYAARPDIGQVGAEEAQRLFEGLSTEQQNNFYKLANDFGLTVGDMKYEIAMNKLLQDAREDLIKGLAISFTSFEEQLAEVATKEESFYKQAREQLNSSSRELGESLNAILKCTIEAMELLETTATKAVNLIDSTAKNAADRVSAEKITEVVNREVKRDVAKSFFESIKADLKKHIDASVELNIYKKTSALNLRWLVITIATSAITWFITK